MSINSEAEDKAKAILEKLRQCGRKLNQPQLLFVIENETDSQKPIETENYDNWESKTCFWSSTFKPGYKFAPNKNAWYNKKEYVLESQPNSENKAFKESEPKSNFYDFEQKDLFTNNPDFILRYFNLFKNGTYILTTENPLKADYVLPIQTSQKNGFILQCYESGHINKVYVSTLLSRKIGKEYMNGLNQNDNLVFLTIIENEAIVGIYFYENGVKKFKAHLTENISCREQLHLQGYKVIYNEFDRVEYKFFPLRIQDEINRLIYQSFTASGKPVSNNYYKNEWSVLGRFNNRTYLTSVPLKVTETE